jgi:hypothetical protein
VRGLHKRLCLPVVGDPDLGKTIEVAAHPPEDGSALEPIGESPLARLFFVFRPPARTSASLFPFVLAPADEAAVPLPGPASGCRIADPDSGHQLVAEDLVHDLPTQRPNHLIEPLSDLTRVQVGNREGAVALEAHLLRLPVDRFGREGRPETPHQPCV